MDTCHESARDIPVAASVDVIVCGGGPAGVSAAIAAGRAGASVLLIEVHGCLGGVWTAGQLAWLFEMERPGFARELAERLTARGACFRSADRFGQPGQSCPGFAYDVELMKELLEDLCRESGVRVLLHTRVVAAEASEEGGRRRITGVVTENCGGRQAWRAPCVVDASGNGDCAALAGCDFAIGRDNAGSSQPLTLMGLMTCDDPEALRPMVSFWRGDLTWSLRKAAVEGLRAALTVGGITPSYGSPTIFHVHDRVFALMINHEYGVSAIDGQQISDATIRARSELQRAVRALRAQGGPFAGLVLVASAEHIGIRDGRRIVGRYVVTVDDLITGRRHTDAVCRCSFNIDIHHSDPQRGTVIERDHPTVHAYDIPYRALLPREVDGLLLAGRCISGDFQAHASYRVTGIATTLGQVAGIAAALAVQRGVLPHELPFSALEPLVPAVDGALLAR